MKKYLVITVLAISIFACREKGDPFEPVSSKKFVKLYGKSKVDVAYDLLQTSDGGYIMAGGVMDFYGAKYTGDHQFYVVKTSPYGNIEWEVSLGDSLMNDTAKAIHITPEGDYIVAGTKSINDTINGVHSNMYVVKIDQSGNIIWENDQIGSAGINETCNAFTAIADGYVLVGSTDAASTTVDSTVIVNQSGTKDQYLIRIDLDGQVVPFGTAQHGGFANDEYVDCLLRFTAGEYRVILLGSGVSNFGDEDITITTKKVSDLAGPTDFDVPTNDEHNDIPGKLYDAGDFIMMIGTDGLGGSSASKLVNYQFNGKDLITAGFDTIITSNNWTSTFGNSVVKAWDNSSYIMLSTGVQGDNSGILANIVSINGAELDPYFQNQEYGLGVNEGVKIIRTSDFGYAILGNTRFGADQKFLFIKMDEFGNIE